jgi:hypothetical protein
MFNRVCWGILVMVAVPGWGQVSTTSSVGDATLTNATQATSDSNIQDNRMMTPPSISGQSYPSVGSAGERSNYLRYGIIFTTAYSDNVLGGVTTTPISDVSYSVWPTISLDQSTPRLHSLLTYSPGFTFYQKTTSRNEADQNASGQVSYRLTQHVTVNVQDLFQKSSSLFNQPDFGSTPISGSIQQPTIGVIAPLADMLSNNAKGGITYQFAPNGMIGANGTFHLLDYTNPAQVPGLYNSRTEAGSAFYNHRLSKKNYVGVTYQYSRISAYPVGTQAGSQSETQIQAILGFYSVYFSPTLSLSFSGGPQHTNVAEAPSPAFSSWSPAGTVSLGWQARRVGLAAIYSRTVSSGGGLVGSYDSTNAGGSANWQLARSWTAGASVSYGIYKTQSTLFSSSNPGGHTISGTTTIRHTIGQHLSIEGGYSRVHQSYETIAAVAAFPNTNREYLSLAYHFARPLGR